MVCVLALRPFVMEVSFLLVSVPDSRVVDTNTHVNVYLLDTLGRTKLEGRKKKC